MFDPTGISWPSEGVRRTPRAEPSEGTIHEQLAMTATPSRRLRSTCGPHEQRSPAATASPPAGNGFAAHPRGRRQRRSDSGALGLAGGG
jgi:hypothetical protein